MEREHDFAALQSNSKCFSLFFFFLFVLSGDLRQIWGQTWSLHAENETFHELTIGETTVYNFLEFLYGFLDLNLDFLHLEIYLNLDFLRLDKNHIWIISFKSGYSTFRKLLPFLLHSLFYLSDTNFIFLAPSDNESYVRN